MLEIAKKWYPERYREYKIYSCPECDVSVEDCGIMDNYCSCCGQAIDWEGVD